MNHKCPRCNYETLNKIIFLKHLNRKIICEPINGDISLDEIKDKYIMKECKNCNVKFSSSYKLNQHVKEGCNGEKSNIQTDSSISNIDIKPFINTNTNSIIENDDVKSNIDVKEIIETKNDNANEKSIICKDNESADVRITEILERMNKYEYMYKEEVYKNEITNKTNEDYRKETDQKIKDLTSSIVVLQERLDKALIVVNNQQNINIANAKIINNISVINSFGSESKDHLTKEFMIECMMKGFEGLADYIMKKHFDPEHPNNHNIKVSEKHLKILYNIEAEQYLRYPKIYDREYYSDEKVWLKVDKHKGICDGIIPSIERSYSDFYQVHDKEISQLKTEHFIDTIIGPLDWSLRVDRLSILEEEYDFGDDDDDIIRQRVCDFANLIENKIDVTI